jgi:hypothetical protein
MSTMATWSKASTVSYWETETHLGHKYTSDFSEFVQAVTLQPANPLIHGVLSYVYK